MKLKTLRTLYYYRTTIVESFRGSRKCSSGHPDYLGPEENSPRRRGVR